MQDVEYLYKLKLCQSVTAPESAMMAHISSTHSLMDAVDNKPTTIFQNHSITLSLTDFSV